MLDELLEGDSGHCQLRLSGELFNGRPSGYTWVGCVTLIAIFILVTVMIIVNCFSF